ncbi:head-tail adaptor protein [Sinorhizobium medicae]|nr:head-tail adaptor protein [Sinorhizobium medicae]MDX0530705.1 head-tail adaptor protein [Sinorhizobium medicae]MDX1206769.1 head-tail adaptor protein [Sinorhizobium medicae]
MALKRPSPPARRRRSRPPGGRPVAASKPTAGRLQHRVSFDERQTVDDGAGNERGVFQEKFKRWAEFRHRGGSETVVAARLEGQNILGVYVRSDAQSRQIGSDWQMRDLRTGTVYAINIVDAVSDRYWVYIQVRSGVAP